MKKFLLTLICFLLPVMVLVAIGEFIARNYPTSYGQKDEYIKTHGREITTLVLGASYAYDGFDATEVNGCYNLANNSQTPEIDLILLRHYKPLLPNLHRVIIAVGYMTLTDPRLEDTDEWYRVGQYQIHAGIPMHPAFSRYGWEFADLYHYAMKIQATIKGEKPDLADEHGLAYSNDNHPSVERLRHRGAVDAKKHTMSWENTYAHNMRSLTDIAEYCSDEGLKLIIISYPVTKEYQEAKDPAQDALRVKACEVLRDEYGATWYDYTSDARFGYEDFSDPSHLNRAGAKKLTRLFISESDSERR